jgi:AmmeMemoRadiSam system protein B
MIIKAYVVPHPPIILPEIGRGEEKKIKNTIDSYRRMAREVKELHPDTVIISSPHAPMFADGFFVASGSCDSVSLRSFGFPRIQETVLLDQAFTEALVERLDRVGIPTALMPGRDEDHGFLIPLRFVHEAISDFKVVHVGISGLSCETHRMFGALLAETSRALSRRTVFIASGDLSHVLKADGPYGLRPEGPAFDAEIARIFREGDLEALFEFDSGFAHRAAECGLRSFQMMVGALEERPIKSELFSYEGTFGVGYAVASVTPHNKNMSG